jgi:hypothetical protein
MNAERLARLKLVAERWNAQPDADDSDDIIFAEMFPEIEALVDEGLDAPLTEEHAHRWGLEVSQKYRDFVQRWYRTHHPIRVRINNAVSTVFEHLESINPYVGITVLFGTVLLGLLLLVLLDSPARPQHSPPSTRPAQR